MIIDDFIFRNQINHSHVYVWEVNMVNQKYLNYYSVLVKLKSKESSKCKLKVMNLVWVSYIVKLIIHWTNENY